MFLTLTLRDMMIQSNGTLFNNITLDDRVSKDILVNMILINSDDRPTISAYWQTQQVMINNWFLTHNTIISKLIDTTEYEYNPIHNYDRHEVYTDTHLINDVSVSNASHNDSGTNNRIYNDKLGGTDSIKSSGTDSIELGGTDSIKSSGDDKTTYNTTHSITHSGTDTDKHTGNDSTTHTGTDTVKVNSEGSGTDKNNNNSTQTDSVAGYNSATFVNQNQTITNGTNNTDTTSTNKSDTTTTYNTTDEITHNTTDTKTVNLTDKDVKSGTDILTHGKTDTTTYGKTDTTTYGKTDTTTYGKTDNGTDNTTISNSGGNTSDTSHAGRQVVEHDAHLFGNIGVTTTQQMIEAQRESVLFNIYDVIVNMFCDDMLLGIWT